MNVEIALTLHAGNPSDDLINVKFLHADAVIPARTTMGWNGVERSDARFNHGVQRNTAGLPVTQTLHVGAVEGTIRSERCKCDDYGNPVRVGTDPHLIGLQRSLAHAVAASYLLR